MIRLAQYKYKAFGIVRSIWFNPVSREFIVYQAPNKDAAWIQRGMYYTLQDAMNDINMTSNTSKYAEEYL